MTPKQLARCVTALETAERHASTYGHRYAGVSIALGLLRKEQAAMAKDAERRRLAHAADPNRCRKTPGCRGVDTHIGECCP